MNETIQNTFQLMNIKPVNLNDWPRVNKISLYLNRTNYLSFCSHRKHIPEQGRPSPLRPLYLFPTNFLTFIRQNFKISDDLFLVINHNFQIVPLFLLFQYISPRFAKIILSPLLLQIPPLF